MLTNVISKTIKYVVITAKAGAIVFIVAAANSPSEARSIGEAVCERYCDRVFDRIDEWARDRVARWKRQIDSVPAPIMPDYAENCGLAPTGVKFCCANTLQRVRVEFSGGYNPYQIPKARHRLYCDPKT